MVPRVWREIATIRNQRANALLQSQVCLEGPARPRGRSLLPYVASAHLMIQQFKSLSNHVNLQISCFSQSAHLPHFEGQPSTMLTCETLRAPCRPASAGCAQLNRRLGSWRLPARGERILLDLTCLPLKAISLQICCLQLSSDNQCGVALQGHQHGPSQPGDTPQRSS